MNVEWFDEEGILCWNSDSDLRVLVVVKRLWVKSCLVLVDLVKVGRYVGNFQPREEGATKMSEALASIGGAEYGLLSGGFCSSFHFQSWFPMKPISKSLQWSCAGRFRGTRNVAETNMSHSTRLRNVCVPRRVSFVRT